jgi:uncharacterized protein (TIGR02466 family)
METKFEIIPIFPTPLYINQIPQELVSDHISLLNNEKLLGKKEGILEEDYGSRSLDTYILNNPLYKNLSNYILQHATNFSQNYLSYNYKNYKFSQSWVSVKNPNQEHVPHSHYHSLISGILFYGESNKDTSKVSFIREDNYSRTLHSHPSNPDSINQFSYNEYSINYSPNSLILFPSYLVHTVSKNITNIPRKSLAFNIIPRDGFGVEGGLTELKFN